MGKTLPPKGKTGESGMDSDLLRRAYEDSPIASAFFGPDSRLVDANRACLELCGVSDLDRIRGCGLFDALEMPESTREDLRRGKPAGLEVTWDFVKPDLNKLCGSKRTDVVPLDVRITPLQSGDGEASGYLVQFLDVTRRGQTEQALRESLERFELVVDATQEGVWDRNLLSGQLYYSPQCKRLLGYGPEEPVENGDDLVHPDDRQRLLDARETHLRDRTPLMLEYRMKHRDGHYHWFRSHVQATWDGGGKPIRVTGAMYDVTQSKETEQALAEALQRFELVVAASQEGIWSYDYPTGVTYRSPQFKKLFGYGADELNGRHDWKALVHPEDLPQVEQALANHLRFRTPYDQEFRARTRSGEWRWFRGYGQAVWDPDGKPLLAAGSWRDITQRKRAEEALRETLERFELVVEATRDGLWDYDYRTGKVYRSPQYKRLLGYENHEFEGPDDWENALQPEDRPRVLESVETHRANGLPMDEEYRLRTKSGEYRWFRDHAIVVYDDAGNPLRTVGSVRDSTERRQAQQTLRESEERYRSLVENARDVIFTLSTEGTVTSLNSFFERATGWSREEWIDRSFVPLLHPEDVPMAMEIRRQLLAGQTPPVHELRIQCRSGEILVAQFVQTPQFCDGRVVGVLGIARDVTEIKRGQRDLLQVNRYLESILSNMEEGVLTLGWNWHVRSCNQAFCRMFGCHESDLIGHTAEPCFPSRETYLQYVRRTLEFLKTGERFTGETVGRRANGELFPLEFEMSILKLDERSVGLLTVVRDITARKRAEEALRHSEEQLQHSQKMEAVGRLAGGVAHDFSNLLTGIIASSDLILEQIPAGRDTEVREEAAEIKRTAERAAALTRQLLAFSRKQVLNPTVLDLNAVISSLEKLLGRMLGERIELVTVKHPALSAVKADPVQVEQVILNLVINARDAMPEGGRLLIETANVDLDESYVRRHPEASTGPHVRVRITDTGCGMDTATLSHMFEPFFTTKGPDVGTGLGLPTAYGIISQSSGSIDVRSEPGAGSTFDVYLPAVAERPACQPLPAEPIGKMEGNETILLVEDEEIVRGRVRKILERRGYTVLEARDPAQAIQICGSRHGPIHLMLSDVIMPHLTGGELAEQLRPAWPQMRVLHMSGYPDNAVVQHGVIGPEAAFLQKPFTAEALARKVRQVLDVDRRPEA